MRDDDTDSPSIVTSLRWLIVPTDKCCDYLSGDAVFDGILEEEKELSALYEPLKQRLAAEDGALGKLAFSIRRSIDLDAWTQRGEELLDLRKAGPFKGRGALLAVAQAELLAAWETGTSAEVAEVRCRVQRGGGRTFAH